MDATLQAKIEQLWETPRVRALREVYDRLESEAVAQRKIENPDSEFYQSQTAKTLTIGDLDEGFFMMVDRAGLLNEDMLNLIMIMDCCGRFRDHPDIHVLLTVNELAAIERILKMNNDAYNGIEPDASRFFQEKNDVLVKFALIAGVGGVLSEEDEEMKRVMSNPAAEGRIVSLIANACDYLQESHLYVNEPEMTDKLLQACDRLLPMMKPGFLTKAFGASAAQLKKQVFLHKSTNVPKP